MMRGPFKIVYAWALTLLSGDPFLRPRYMPYRYKDPVGVAL